MSSHTSRWLSATAITAGSALTLGAFLAPAYAASPAPSSDAVTCFNPMSAATPTGSSSGFTIFTYGNVELSNGETEGSVAAAGTVLVQRDSSSAEYPFHHSVSGNTHYEVPVVDG